MRISFYRDWQLQASSDGRVRAWPISAATLPGVPIIADSEGDAKVAIDAWYLEYEEGTLWARRGSPWPLTALLMGVLALLSSGVAILFFALWIGGNHG